MEISEIFSLIGGLCLFLFGMHIMGEALERKAGGKLRTVLGRLTSNKAAGFLTGMVVTAIIQSSSATTVMTVGFVNSGLMSLRQAIMVIMGANIGTTMTAWILSLVGLEQGNIFTLLLKPSSFSPILALIGVVLYVFLKNDKKKETGLILLGFSTLMFGMETMSDAVSGLKDIPGFADLFLLFSNPLLGALVGMILTVIIQSSSASTGILQALAATGQVTFASAIPIIIGQNVGTCATSLISCVGATRDAKRTALVHLSFNLIGATVWLIVYCIVKSIFQPVLLSQATTAAGIAVVHTLFNVGCTILMLPMTGLLEKLVVKLVPGKDEDHSASELDERLFASPSIALQRSHDVTADMALDVSMCVKETLASMEDADKAESVCKSTKHAEKRKEELDKYLIQLSSMSLDTASHKEVAMLLKVSAELSYISRQNLEIAECVYKLHQEELSSAAREEIMLMSRAVNELLKLSMSALMGSDPKAAATVPALTQVIHGLKRDIHERHVGRLQNHICSAAAGVVWLDILTALERISDHFANICSHVLEGSDVAEAPETYSDEKMKDVYRTFEEKFSLSAVQ